MKHYTLKVVGKEWETSDSVTISFKQPGLKKIHYKAGQYLTLIFRINGRRYMRPYSFSSAPGIDTTLDVTVKRVIGGVVSNHICDVLAVGDVVEVLEPMGDFTIPQDNTDIQHYVFWAAGSGVTPVFSLLRWVLTNMPRVTASFVYGNRDPEQVIFERKITDLVKEHNERLNVWHFQTKLVVADHPFRIQGRIKPELVFPIIHQNLPLDRTLHYICGPFGLKQSIRSSLTAANVPDKNIFSEDFEIVKDEADFMDINTEKVLIEHGGAEHVVEVVKYKSILEAGLDAGLELSYSCQTGNCSVCKGKLITGRAKQLLHKHKDLLDDEYQLCCTYPLSSDVKFQV